MKQKHIKKFKNQKGSKVSKSYTRSKGTRDILLHPYKCNYIIIVKA